MNSWQRQLVLQPAVVRELKVTPEQLLEIQQVAVKNGVIDRSDLAEIMSKRQIVRFDQLRFQMGILRGDVAKTLADSRLILTTKQTEQLKVRLARLPEEVAAYTHRLLHQRARTVLNRSDEINRLEFPLDEKMGEPFDFETARMEADKLSGAAFGRGYRPGRSRRRNRKKLDVLLPRVPERRQQ